MKPCKVISKSFQERNSLNAFLKSFALILGLYGFTTLKMRAAAAKVSPAPVELSWARHGIEFKRFGI